MLLTNYNLFSQNLNGSNTMIHSAVFGSERKYKAIVRANTIKRYLRKNAYTKIEDDVEDELEKKQNEGFKSSESVVTSGSIFFEDISVCVDNTPCSFDKHDPKSNIFQHNIDDEMELESFSFDLGNHNLINTNNQQQRQQTSMRNNISGNTTKTLVESESNQLWKNIEFQDLALDNNSIVAIREQANSIIYSDTNNVTNRKQQVIENKFDDPLEFFNSILMNMLESILQESIENYKNIEKIFELIDKDKHVIEKYIKYCYSQNSLSQNVRLKKLIDEYLIFNSKGTNQENRDTKIQFNDLLILTKNNILEHWILEHQNFFIKHMNEKSLLLILNINYFPIELKKGKINNKLKKEILNVMENFLQIWWRSEIGNSSIKSKGLAKHVKFIKILVTRDDQSDGSDNDCFISQVPITTLKRRSLKQRFLVGSKNNTVHEILIGFLNSKHYIFENVSENEIVIAGKN